MIVSAGTSASVLLGAVGLAYVGLVGLRALLAWRRLPRSRWQAAQDLARLRALGSGEPGLGQRP